MPPEKSQGRFARLFEDAEQFRRACGLVELAAIRSHHG
jgi:hypothetical protein